MLRTDIKDKQRERLRWMVYIECGHGLPILIKCFEVNSAVNLEAAIKM